MGVLVMGVLVMGVLVMGVLVMEVLVMGVLNHPDQKCLVPTTGEDRMVIMVILILMAVETVMVKHIKVVKCNARKRKKGGS